jgi:hypothetical protein
MWPGNAMTSHFRYAGAFEFAPYTKYAELNEALPPTPLS